MIIAIDGPSGTGKSTIAKKVASKLNYLYFDTGAMYRSFAYLLSKKHISFEDDDKIKEALSDFDFDIQKDQSGYVFLLDSEDVSATIRQEKISKLASEIAKKPYVRKWLLPVQKSFARKGNIVCEGRDMGSVVFPEAEVKIFLTATPEIRAERRLKQLIEKFPEKASAYSFEKVLEEINARDHQDTTRKVAPLKKVDDAYLLDTSNLTIDEIVDEVISYKKTKEES
ncbi:MAG: Cytidylate kinase [Chlamydiia bacterium]|nr:Cytidylate kinase [Chlamydiia bacterium]